MKKGRNRFLFLSLLLGLFLILCLNVSAFEITNLDGLNTNYFSMTEPKVFIRTSYNDSNFSVNYLIGNSTYTSIFNLTEDTNNNYIGHFSLIDLIETDNSSFVGARQFKVKINQEEKIIYLDFEKPEFNLINYSIDTNSQKLELSFSYSDNSNQIKKVSLFERKGLDEIYLADLTNKTTYTLNLTKEGVLVLLFKIEDLAGNENSYEKILTIDDIFKPILNEIFLTLKDDKFILNFDVSDETALSRYEVKQDLEMFSGILSGKEFKKEVTLPFNDGVIEVKIYDTMNNSISKNLTLNTPISITFNNLISNKKEFTFTSNANNCFLETIDDENISKEFTKDNDEFTITLDISRIGSKTLSFYCELNNFREYFTKTFFYDTNPPPKTNINLEKTDDGGIKISWAKVEDNEDESEVIYQVYRDDKRIYQGTRLYYLDLGVTYPNEYSYFVRTQDLAGNYEESEIEKIIPLKKDIYLVSNLKDSEETQDKIFNLKLTTEKSNDVIIKVFNRDRLIDSKTYHDINSSDLETKLNLETGTNKILIEITDDFGNKKELTSFITYKEDLLLNNNIIEEPTEPITNKTTIIRQPTINELLNENESLNKTTKSLTPELSNRTSYWILFLIILIIIIISTYYISNLNKEENNQFNPFKETKKKKKIKSKKEHHFHFGQFGTNVDDKLKKSLEEVKKKRLKKQQELEKLKSVEKNKRPLTEYEKEKLKAISERRSGPVYDFNALNNKKKPTIRKQKDLDGEEMKLVSKLAWVKEIFKKDKDKKRKEESLSTNSNKLDLNEYLNKITNKKSWKNTREYLLSTKLKEEQKRAEKERKKLAEIQEKEAKQQEKIKKELELAEKKQRELEEKRRIAEEKKLAKQSLDEYLEKKKKKRRFYFAEKLVNRDIKNRMKRE